MKKIFITASIVTMGILLNLNAKAESYENFCPAVKPKKNITGSLSSLTGVSALSKNIIEKEIKKALYNETKSNFKVNLDSFWGINPASGKFSSLSLKGENFQYKDAYFKSLNAQTICTYNDIEYKNKDIVFNENTVLKYDITMDENGFSKTFANIQNTIKKELATKDKFLSSFFDIKNPKAKIRDDVIDVEFYLVPFPKITFLDFVNTAKPVKITFSTGLKAENGKLALTNFQSESFTRGQIPEKFTEYLNSLDLISYDIDINKNTKGTIKFEDVKIQNSKIQFLGYVIIPKTETK